MRATFADRPWALLLAAVLALTALRVWALTQNAADLYVDEAQYWAWAQDPAWGYFSKPPLLAWLIAGAQGLCGTSEACVRAPSPILWGVTSLVVAAIGATLFGARTALWAGLCALLAPGVAYSARLISTDVPLLFFWAVAVLAFVRLRQGGAWRWGLLLGAAFGLGLLSKYAMIYLLGGLAIAAIVDPASRRTLMRPATWIGLGLGGLLLVPNLLWNARHDFATLKHTADNASGSGAHFDPGAALEFLAAQFGLAGPVVFGAVLFALWRTWRGRGAGETRLLLALSAPLWLALTAMALVTEANANWAAPALIAAFVLAPAFLLPVRGGVAWLSGGLAFGVAVQALLLWADPQARTLVVADKPVFGRTVGWAEFADAVADRAETQGLSVVAAERRSELAALIYYTRDRGLEVRAWPPAPGAQPRDHFEMSRPLTGGPVLAVAACDDPARFRGWARVAALGPVDVFAGAGATRRFHLFRLEGPAAQVQPPSPCSCG